MQVQEAPRVYEGEGDALMSQEQQELQQRIILMPDALPSRTPDTTPRIRILWGQHLLEDILAGRYRSLVCAVNAEDNSHGIISQLAELLPTSQWDQQSITSHARHFATSGGRTKVVKYDMDMVEVLAVLRPPGSSNLTIDDLSVAFKMLSEMIRRRSGRLPVASVSFLGARANKLIGSDGHEPAFETVLKTMYEAGFDGDVYPSPAMWQLKNIGLFARYPFSPALDEMRSGGY